MSNSIIVSPKVYSANHLLSIFEEATHEIATTALGYDANGRLVSKPNSSGNPGALVALQLDGRTFHLGIASSDPGLRELAAALMMLEPDDDPLSDDDVSDAVGEIANLIVGNVKSRLCEQNSNANVTLGTPLRWDGQKTPRTSQEMVFSNHRIGDTNVELIVLLTTNEES